MNNNTTFHHNLISIITSIGTNTPGEKDRHTVSPKDRQAPSSHHSFSQRGLCLVEIPNEEFTADIPRGAPNLQVPILSGGERQSTDSHDLLGSYNEGIFIPITVLSWRFILARCTIVKGEQPHGRVIAMLPN